MRKNHPNILAVNPGSRYLGIAVFEEHELIDWGIKIIKGNALSEKTGAAKRIISDLIAQYGINVITLKRLHPSRSSDDLNQLVKAMDKLSNSKGLKIYYSFFSGEGKINKRQMAEFILQEYAFLSHEFEKEKANLNPYHIRMFEAVALGMTCLNQLQNKH